MSIFSDKGTTNGVWSWKDKFTLPFYIAAVKLPYLESDKYMLTLHLLRRGFQLVYFAPITNEYPLSDGWRFSWPCRAGR